MSNPNPEKHTVATSVASTDEDFPRIILTKRHLRRKGQSMTRSLKMTQRRIRSHAQSLCNRQGGLYVARLTAHDTKHGFPIVGDATYNALIAANPEISHTFQVMALAAEIINNGMQTPLEVPALSDAWQKVEIDAMAMAKLTVEYHKNTPVVPHADVGDN